MPATLPPTERQYAAPPSSPAAANGWGSPQQPRITPLQRERKPALILAGLLLALACGAVTAALFLRVGGRVAVLAVAQDVPVGQVVTAQDLTDARISYDPSLHALSPRLRDQVVGRIAAVELKPGSLLTREQLTTQAVPTSGQVVIGLSLKPGQLPGDPLRRGDPVRVLLTSGGTPTAAGQTKTVPANASVLVQAATVYSERVESTGSSGTVVVSLVIPEQQVARVVQAGAAGQIALALLPAGTSTAGGSP